MPRRGVHALLVLVVLATACSRAGGAAAPPAVTGTAAPAASSTTTNTSTSTSTTSTTTTAPPSTLAIAPPSTTTAKVPAATRPPETQPPPPPTDAPTPTDAPAPEPAPETIPPPPSPPPPRPARQTVFAVGDSVMLRAAEGLRALPDRDVTVDAEVGRQFRVGIPLVAAAVASGATAVVIHLGTNGPVSEASFEEMMAAAAGAKVVIVTVQLPDDAYPHEAPTNAVLREGAARHGAALVDWNEVTNGRPELLRPDGYHMEAATAPLYVSLVSAAL